MEVLNADDRRWYVLHFINSSRKPTPQKSVDVFNKEGHTLELFAPIIRPARVVNGKVEYKEKLLTYYYVFVNGVFDEVKALCSRHDNGFSFLLDRGSENRYAIVKDSDMDNFKIFARTYTNTVPFFNIEDIELSEGDLVEVVGGDYDGLKGWFMPKSRSNKGNIVIAVTVTLGIVVWDIDVKYVRILEFAHGTRRQYDLVDSFIPKLLPILRKFHDKEELTDKDKSLLNIFNQRMGTVSLANYKTEAKLLAMLMCVQFMLGDMPGYRHTRERFEKLKSAVTNFWTLALVELMICVVLSDMSKLKKVYEKLPNSTEKLTNTQKQLIEEFQHYIHEC